MKKILITTALPLEMQAIKTNFKKQTFRDFEFEFLILGVGNLNTTYELSSYLLKHEIDFVVNIGICGKKETAKKDIFLAYRTKYLSNNREVIHPLYLDFINIESLGCSDQIITDENMMGDENYVDMESMGIEIVCNRQKTPYAIFKLPFDSVSKSSLQVDKKEILTSLENIDTGKIIVSLQEFFQKNISKIDFGDLSVWKEKFSLTFSEFEMFKKALNREIAFGKGVEEILKSIENMSQKEIQKFLKN